MRHLLLALIVILIGVGCAVTTPTAPLNSPTAVLPTLTATSLRPIASPTLPLTLPTRTASPLPTVTTAVLARGDVQAVVRALRQALETNQPERLADLIGTEGVAFAPFAVGARPPGYNNAEDVIAAVAPALIAQRPTCRGYNPNYGDGPAKALVVFEDLGLDWEALHLSGQDVVASGFVFYRRATGWELTFIVPLPAWAWEDLQATLQPCP